MLHPYERSLPRHAGPRPQVVRPLNPLASEPRGEYGKPLRLFRQPHPYVPPPGRRIDHVDDFGAEELERHGLAERVAHVADEDDARPAAEPRLVRPTRTRQ